MGRFRLMRISLAAINPVVRLDISQKAARIPYPTPTPACETPFFSSALVYVLFLYAVVT